MAIPLAMRDFKAVSNEMKMLDMQKVKPNERSKRLQIMLFFLR